MDLPGGPWGCVPGPSDTVLTITLKRKYSKPQVPCFDYTTLGDELDHAGLSWRFYSSWYGEPSSGFGAVWSSYQAVKHIYDGPDWANIITARRKRFLTDVGHGKLANFTWDHAGLPQFRSHQLRRRVWAVVGGGTGQRRGGK